ncbi:MAG TPA: M3 family metallopeptidase [Thermoanaerobaculia bacterium]|nr:M3 family metallopeptidase [Thermoanaerobaculia bacterium]
MPTITSVAVAADERVTLPILDDVTLIKSCTQVLREARENVAALERVPLEDVTVESILDQWDDDAIELENIAGVVAILNNVHPDRRVREAADRCTLEISSFETELFQNENLYARVKAVRPRTEAQKQFRKDLLEAFEDSGVALPLDKRKRFKEITERITELSQEFGRNVRDNSTTVTFTREECDGLPQSWMDRVPKDEQENVQVGFDSPDYIPFMNSSRNEAARERYYVAYQRRGTPRNIEILDEIVELRREIASLYGEPSYAHYVTRRRMVENPETVHAFLADVKATVAEAERRDLEELRKLKSEMTGGPLAETRLQRWDLSFYRERLRELRFQVDQEALRRYFPTPPAIEWLLSVSQQIYGVRFERVTVPVWYEDVIYFDVRDADSNRFMGGIYLDLFPREGKYKHAAAWPVRGASRRTGRTPISVLVTNFNRDGLTHNEIETFFHELGHVLHGVFSVTEYSLHSGTSVQRDFVEAPSQMYEEWARRLESLQTIRDHCPDCPVVDQALVDRLNDARRFGQGIDYARQHLYAAFDMVLAGPRSGKVLDVWKAMELETPLGHVPETEFPGSFGHITGGYAAGYYGYMWSKVLALDMLTEFGDNLMNPDVGKRFRRLILSRGGEEPARQLVERFLGRPVSSEAFFTEITGKRD